MSDKPTGLALLRVPFPPNQINKLPKPTCAPEEWKKLQKGRCAECGGWHATTSTIHLDFVGHAALTDRLLDADPQWSWEPIAFTEQGLPRFDANGGMWIKLTVCGVTRYGYGDAQGKTGGNAIKECIGDALRNAAMRFGAALDLWHKGDLHGDEDDAEKVIADSKSLADRVVTQSLSALEKGDAYAMLEVWEELSVEEQTTIWKEFNTKQKNEIRELLQQARGNRVAAD